MPIERNNSSGVQEAPPSRPVLTPVRPLLPSSPLHVPFECSLKFLSKFQVKYLREIVRSSFPARKSSPSSAPAPSPAPHPPSLPPASPSHQQAINTEHAVNWNVIIVSPTRTILTAIANCSLHWRRILRRTSAFEARIQVGTF